MKSKVYRAYELLLKHFGPQGWWPTTRTGGVRPEYHVNKVKRKLTENERFEICVGAILTQNTAWSNVEKALINLNSLGLMDVKRILRAPLNNLHAAVRPSGYFRQKAERLKIFAGHVSKKWNGKLSDMLSSPAARLREELLGIKGIGKETADSIMLYAASKPVFVVDAYTKRLGLRTGFFDYGDYDSIQRYFADALPVSTTLYAEYHALIVALGKFFCRSKRPCCTECPLKKGCSKKY